MKKLNKIMPILVCFVFLSITQNFAVAAEETGGNTVSKPDKAPALESKPPADDKSAQKNDAKAAEPAKQETQEITKEEILLRLNTLLEYHADIRSNIPGLTRIEKDGKVHFELNGTPIEELDRDTLFKLLVAVNNQVNQKNLEKLDRQMKNLKQIQEIDKTQRNLRQINSLNRTQRQLQNINRKNY